MTMKIIEALKLLDPSNDDHWTNDGDAAMKAVEELVGTSSINRDDVLAVAPRFCRTNLEFPGDEKPEEETTPEEQVEEDSESPIPPVETAPEATEEAPVASEQDAEDEGQAMVDEAKRRKENLAIANKKVDDISAKKAAIDAELAEAQQAQIEANQTVMQNSHIDDQKARMAYIESQKKQRRDRYLKQQGAQKVLGITGKVAPSALDKALADRPRSTRTIAPGQ